MQTRTLKSDVVFHLHDIVPCTLLAYLRTEINNGIFYCKHKLPLPVTNYSG